MRRVTLIRSKPLFLIRELAHWERIIRVDSSLETEIELAQMSKVVVICEIQ